MLGGILVHAMLFHFVLGLLFSLMHVGIAHLAGHSYSVTPVRRKPDGLAVELPGTAIFGGQLVLVRAFGLVKQPINVRTSESLSSLLEPITGTSNNVDTANILSSTLFFMSSPLFD
jgi:hypothetical protein